MTDLQGPAAVPAANWAAPRYAPVNTQWPKHPSELPTLAGQEALSAAKRLYRIGMGRAYRGRWKLTSGRRYTYPRGGVFYVNASRGWWWLVHDIGHHCHRKLHPDQTGHGLSHGWIEKNLIAHVVKSGWLDGRLRREPKPKPDAAAIRHARAKARLARWEARARRAATAIRKLKRTVAYYEKRA